MRNWFQSSEFSLEKDYVPFKRKPVFAFRSTLVSHEFHIDETIVKTQKHVTILSADTVHETHITDLIYYIKEGLMEGTLNNSPLTPAIKGHSGGGGGHTHVAKKSKGDNGIIYDDKAVDNPDYTNQKEVKSKGKYVVRGGPLPMGVYHIIPNPTEGKSLGKLRARLILKEVHDPNVKTLDRRGDIFIHGPGPKGSDGCIVIEHDPRKKLIDGLVKSKGGVLTVYASKWAIKDTPVGRGTLPA